MLDVDFFEAKLNRLKTVLSVTKDKEAGEALGLKDKAFNARKTRGSFPEKELRALAQQRPELGIDVDYVLTGITTEARARLDAKQARIARAVDAGLSIEDIRGVERLATSASPERLLSLGAMLSTMQTAEFDAIYTLAERITELRSALSSKPAP